jgi:hypothetical protein
MEKNEIISRVEENLHNKYGAGGIDSELVEDCVDSTLEAINYTHSCKSDSELFFCCKQAIDQRCSEQCLGCYTYKRD